MVRKLSWCQNVKSCWELANLLHSGRPAEVDRDMWLIDCLLLLVFTQDSFPDLYGMIGKGRLVKLINI